MSSEEQAALKWFTENHMQHLEKLAAEELVAIRYQNTINELCTKKIAEFLDKNPTATVTADDLIHAVEADARKMVPNEVKQMLIDETMAKLDDYFDKLGPRI